MARKKVPRINYSEKTKRHATQLQGVYERQVTREKIGPDVCYDISYKNEGKKVWEKVGWKSEGYSAELARDVRNHRIKALRHGEELPQQKKKAITFKALAEKYLEWSAENKNREGIEDKSRYENHLKDRFDDKRLDEITSFDLEQMKSEMAKKDYRPKTIAHCLGLIRTMYNRASDWSLYQGQNPVVKVKKPVIQNARDRFLSFEEAEILLRELKRNPQIKKEYKELKDPKLHDIALLSLHTGARAGEIFNLKGHDISFTGRLITLRDTKNTETRHCPMTDAAMEMLKRRIPDDPNSFIFTNSDNGKIREVSNAFERAVDRLKMNDGVMDARKRVLFHSLRHTFASWLAIQGTPIYTIAKLMGHKSIAMSERYSHLSPDHKNQAVMGMEQAFNEQRNIITDRQNVSG
jgi:integrase